MRSAVHKRIAELDARQWNALIGTDVPFLRHEFLVALERTGCVGPGTGWEPRYITLQDEDGLAAAVPSFTKSHSYGEFVFDFGWAQAYARLGLRYYPKLTISIPFTPATGPRLLIRKGLDVAATSKKLIAAVEGFTAEHSLSSAHALFLDDPARTAYERAGWLLRRDCQFHWTNRGYASFDAFLETFTAEKRKKVRRERRSVAEAGITFDTRLGSELDARQLDRVYSFMRNTFLQRGNEPYLTRAFFTEIVRTLGDALMVKIALHAGEPVGASVFFRSADTLYGRYWGQAPGRHYDCLHFEACYHQGVEYCIEHGITKFDPGAQGDHKIARGFEPTLTWSAHFIADRRFRAAVDDYLEREGASIDAYTAEMQEHVPYRQQP